MLTRYISWLAIGLAAAYVAIVGLTINELSSEHVTHSLEVSENQHDGHLAPAA